MATLQSVKLQTQSQISNCEDVLTNKEDGSDISHINIGTADTDDIFMIKM